MKVLGTVKDAATEVPLPGAKISLYVREEELAVLQSDSEGEFKHESESQYLGEILICKVEKAGYEPQKVIQEFEEDEVTLAIKLVPGKDEKIELTVNLKDDNKNSLKGVNISLEVSGEEVGVGISDKDGIFKISLSPDLEGKTINYKAELGGFELASGAVLLKKETSVKITMKKPPVPPSNRKWLKIAAGAAGIVAVILVAIIISQIIQPERPVINSFEADPSAISAGEGSTLSWSVSDATRVTIEPGIGDVALAGTRLVSPPTGTTFYALTATNDAGKHSSSVTRTLIVIVKDEEVNLPVISSFEASPSAISAEEGSTLSWSVSDATSVTIDPEIGSVDLKGEKRVFPTESTTYTITATNEAGKDVDTTTVNVNVVVQPKKPVIKYFKASPSEIKPDESATLSWSVSGAASVTIDPEIGSVGLTDTKVVSPTKTTTYTLTATNDAGRRDATVRVMVEVPPEKPGINYFEASPSKISAGESSTLRWSVSDASSVRMDPGVVKVPLKGTMRVSPAKTITYTLTATNEAGSVKDTVIVEVLPTPPVITWDFETGDLSGWTKTGTAFNYQPTYGDNPTERERGQPSNHQGYYWIGSYEKYPGPDSGYLPGTVQGDKPQGTLTSSPFTINTNKFNQISFLIGGGNHPFPTDPTCVNLVINGKIVKTATGENKETMERVTWYVSEYNGQEAVIKLYDLNSENWGHINFDDVKFEEIRLY